MAYSVWSWQTKCCKQNAANKCISARCIHWIFLPATCWGTAILLYHSSRFGKKVEQEWKGW